jgi:phosphohistidine phosphatase
MQVYLLRHGLAEEARPGVKDANRALVPEGVKKLREVMKLARAADVQPTLILTSPYRRAKETAEVAARELGYKGALVPAGCLTPDGSPETVWDELRAHKGEEQVLLVGHEPLFSGLAAYLLGAPSLQVDMKKGALVRVDMEHFGAQPRGVLRWMVTPKLGG